MRLKGTKKKIEESQKLRIKIDKVTEKQPSFFEKNKELPSIELRKTNRELHQVKRLVSSVKL